MGLAKPLVPHCALRNWTILNAFLAFLSLNKNPDNSAFQERLNHWLTVRQQGFNAYREGLDGALR